MDQQQEPESLTALTPREWQVLALMAESRSHRAIGQHLSMSKKTVESHVGNIFPKLGLRASPAHELRVLAARRFLRATGCHSRSQGVP